MIGTDLFMLVFRFFHVVSGILWVGSAFLFNAFLGPSMAELGPASMPVVDAMVRKRKVAKAITVLASITVAAGWIMWIRYAIDAGFTDWISSSFGLVLTIGAAAGSVAWYIGFTGIAPNIEKLAEIGASVAASSAPPSAETAAELERIGSELEKHGKSDLVLVLVAAAAMATARYW